jgi:predicted DNA-binding transcriptional regulator YafY
LGSTLRIEAQGTGSPSGGDLQDLPEIIVRVHDLLEILVSKGGTKRATRKPGAVRAVLGVVARLMRGERLTVASVAPAYPFKGPALRQHLRAVAAMVPGVRMLTSGPETWAYEWPAEHQVEASSVWALTAARCLLGGLHETGLGFHLGELLNSHRARARDDVPAADLTRMFVPVARSVDGAGYDATVVDTVMNAVISGEEITATYIHFEGDDDKIAVRPHSIVVADEGLYLLAQCISSTARDHADRRRVYNLRRLSAVKRTKRRFGYPVIAEYDPVGDLHHTFGVFMPGDGDVAESVVLQFDRGWRSYLQHHRLHRAQEQLQVNDDGTTDVTMRVHIDYELVRWVRGLGDEVVVVAPGRLADWVSSRKGAKWTREKADPPTRPTGKGGTPGVAHSKGRRTKRQL